MGTVCFFMRPAAGGGDLRRAADGKGKSNQLKRDNSKGDDTLVAAQGNCNRQVGKEAGAGGRRQEQGAGAVVICQLSVGSRLQAPLAKKGTAKFHSRRALFFSLLLLPAPAVCRLPSAVLPPALTLLTAFFLLPSATPAQQALPSQSGNLRRWWSFLLLTPMVAREICRWFRSP